MYTAAECVKPGSLQEMIYTVSDLVATAAAKAVKLAAAVVGNVACRKTENGRI